MTREEIENTPKIVDFMIDEIMNKDSKDKLHKRLEEICKMAIKALEQEQYYKDLTESYERTINKLTKAIAEQEPKWNPVSEKMPEDGKLVLFSDIDEDIMIGYHVKGRPNTHFTQDGTYEDMKNVRAWMSLPKAESEV